MYVRGSRPSGRGPGGRIRKDRSRWGVREGMQESWGELLTP